jgi:3-methyl-2-oxobutanoate hydroxymethyltransferase
MKKDGEKITFLTSYDYPTAQFAEAAGMDMLLVGDSLGMCVYGYPGTIPVVMDQCIRHAEAVRRGAPNTFVVGDMPFMSYQSSVEKAVENTGRFLKEAEPAATPSNSKAACEWRPRSGPSWTPASSSWGTSG